MRSLFAILVLLMATLLSCRTLGPDLPLPLSGQAPLVVGHGGRGFASIRNGIPANSMESLVRAIEAEHADGIEMDVQMSGDSIPILYHGDFMERITSCTGCPDEFSAEELKDCRYNNTPTAKLNKYPVATLEEAMAYFADWDSPPLFSLNVKVGTSCAFTQSQGYQQKLAEEIVKMVDEYNAVSWVLVECPSVEFLLEIRKLNPDITIMVDGDIYPDDFNRVIDNDLDGIVARLQSFSREEVAAFHAANKQVVMYGIKLRKDAIDALEKGADQLQADDIRVTNEVLRNAFRD